MRNLIAISIPSVVFSSHIVQSQTIYDGVDEFIQGLSDRLRGRLQSAGVGCDPSIKSFKPEGAAFSAGPPDKPFWVTVCPERLALPNAEVTIHATPRVGFFGHVFKARGQATRTRNWSLFEPIFQEAVRAEFPSYKLEWLTIDEYITQ